MIPPDFLFVVERYLDTNLDTYFACELRGNHVEKPRPLIERFTFPPGLPAPTADSTKKQLRVSRMLT
jgi:hypothetical protein